MAKVRTLEVCFYAESVSTPVVGGKVFTDNIISG
jgi:hypothetical protein